MSSTLVTEFAVGASVGLVADPVGAGSGLAYHLQNHTLARVVRDGVVLFGLALAETIAALTGIEIDDTLGLTAFAGVGFVFGIGWEVTIGHR